MTAPTRAFCHTVLSSLAVCSGLALVLALCHSLTVAAQGTTPERGFHPNGSYALTDIETIGMTNGNMTLRVPLASLPAGRGGSPGPSVSLIYNSKFYDSRTEIHSDPLDPNNSYTYGLLQQSEHGGWQYGYGYSIQQYNRFDEYANGYIPPCGTSNSDEYTYHWKLKVSFPDGSEHEFAPLGYHPSYNLNDNYYSVDLNGYVTDVTCGGHWGSTTGMTYYSTDGSYLRLEIAHDGDTNPYNNAWTLFMPNGSRVTGGNSNQRVYDRNNNYTEIQNVTLGNGHPATKISDQLGRSITIESDAALSQNYIIALGVNGEEVRTTVKWKTVWVYKSYQATMLAPYWVNKNKELLTQMLVVEQVTTPTQAGSLTWNFRYNASDTQPSSYTNGWGNLTYLKLPTDAEARYQYANDAGIVSGSEVLQNYPTRKDLTYRLEYDGVSPSLSPTPLPSPCTATENCTTETWLYSVASSQSSLTAPDGGVTSEYYTDTQTSAPGAGGLVYKSVRPDGSMVERIWASGFASNHVKTEFTSIKDNAGNYVKTAIKDYSYDRNGNLTQAKEYDWVSYASVPRSSGRPTGVPAGAPFKRVTNNTYYNPTPDASDTTTVDYDTFIYPTTRRFYNLLESSEVGDGASQPLTRFEYVYDDTSLTGNLLQQKSWDSMKGSFSRPLSTSNSVFVSNLYDSYGNIAETTDARGTRTQFIYGAINGFSGVYPTEVKAAYATSLERSMTNEYDFWTGAVTRATDVSNNVSTLTTYDAFARPTLVKAAEGKVEETRTSTSYSDVMRRVIVRSDKDAVGDAKLVSVQHYDQLGRVRLSRQLENASTQSETNEEAGVKVQTRYRYGDPYSYVLTSQPYRATTSGGAGEPTRGWSRIKQDRGGKVVEAQTFHGSGLPSPWGGNTSGSGAVTTVYDAEYTTVTDQAGKVRRSVTDAMGRPARVDEPDANGSLGATTAPVQPTSYTYDALSNLTQVTQGSQTRTFLYSSLSRLRSATNPESGTSTYVYDGGGNLLTKTDARNVTANYEYDALSRNTRIYYTNDPNSTPEVLRRYDGNPSNRAPNSWGRLWQSETGGASGTLLTYDSYDALGRPLSQRQQFKVSGVWGTPYAVQRNYDRASAPVSQVYPSGRTVSYTYDPAGRLNSFTGSLGDGVSRTYANNIAYDESGRMRQERFGTDTAVYNKRFYNASRQLSEIRVSTQSLYDQSGQPSNTNWNRGAIINHYSNQSWAGTGTDNNGNLRKQDIYIPNDDSISGYNLKTQTYDYDSLNRLDKASESGGVAWQQDYDYDRWGNRTISAANTWGGVSEPQFELDSSNNNQLHALGDAGRGPQNKLMQYDPAGNLVRDAYTGAGTRAYDAENRMASAQDGYGGTSSYTYNADGQRVKRNTGGQEVWQVYGMDGELLAEYAANAPSASPQKEYGYRSGELLVTASGAPCVNVALAQNGATVSASSAYPGFAASGVINGDRKGLGVGQDGYWSTAASGFPAWLQIDFAGAQTIDEVDVFTTQDNYNNPVEPTGASTFTLYGLQGYEVQYWTGSAWATVSGASVTGNNLLWRKFNFSPVTTSKIRVLTSASPDGYSRLTEVEAWQAGTGGAQVQWFVSDKLGTPRMVVEKAGTMGSVKRHDYFPFGEEIGIGIGGRTTNQGYSQQDGVRQQFTGQERDNETGLDYMKARYYSSTQGRFTSPDKPFVDQRQTNPQSWNLYAYVRNNPCNNTDPSGQCSVPSGLKAGSVGLCIEAFIAAPKIGHGGIGHGDGRGFDGNNENLTSRVRVDVILTATENKIIHSTTATAGVSEMTVGVGTVSNKDKSTGETEVAVSTVGIQGTASANSDVQVSPDALVGTPGFGSNTTLTVTGTGANGAQALGNALALSPIPAVSAAGMVMEAASPAGTIDFKMGFQISGQGYVKFTGGAVKGYPSYAAYAYRIVDGKVRTQVLREIREGKIEELTQPMKPIR